MPRIAHEAAPLSPQVFQILLSLADAPLHGYAMIYTEITCLDVVSGAAHRGPTRRLTTSSQVISGIRTSASGRVARSG
jgi:hypothetical protein